MAAKLLRTMSDDNNPKPIGCMAGIFHLFGHGHFLSKRRHVTNTPPPAPPNNNNTISVVPKPEMEGLNNIVKDSIVYSRHVRVRTSSTNQQSPTLTYIDSPRPSLPSPPKSTKSKLLYGFRDSSRFFHPKESPRFSYDGRESKIKELPPRYSLDSKSPTTHPLIISEEEHGSHRRQPSIVAKLMGLEDLHQVDHVSDELYHPISIPEHNKPTAPSKRLELAPWKRPQGTTVYGQIEKRLAQLEFHKSGKDLRALKQILQAMQNCEPKKQSSETLLDSGPAIIKRIAPTNKSRSPTFAVKPTKIEEYVKKPTSSCVVPVPGLRKLDLGYKKRVEKKQSQPSLEISRSPRQQKTNLSNRPESAKKINQSRQAKSKSKAKLKLSYGGGLGSDNSSSCGEQSNSISVQSDSINSQEEMEVSSAYTRQERKKIGSRIREDDFIGKIHTPEQPSPVSVLDTITFEDEPPSPVPMINRGFQDVEPLSYNKTPENTEPKFTSTHDQGYSSLGIMYLSPMKTIQHNKEVNSPGDGYISQILQASGLLNSGKSKYIDEIQKRLVSDVVNELLMENIASNRSIPSSIPQQKQLLKRLCSEIDELQCKLDEEDDDCFRKMLEMDLGRRSMDWKLGFGDNSGIVVDIERMVFRDLIWEVVSSEALDLRAVYLKPKRQLFQN